MQTPEHVITFENGNRLLRILQDLRITLREHGYVHTSVAMQEVNAAIRIVTGEDRGTNN